ncbi:MAG: YceI family protein [Candidatus Sedimenticola sp. (ex Thyasira tokunagai)]
MKKLLLSLIFTLLALGGPTVHADEYLIDTKGSHAFIQFQTKHLGYSWLYGRFNTFDGTFSYDENNPSASKVEVTIDPASVDSNHAERDKHLRGKKFLNVAEFPDAGFVGTSFKETGNGRAILKGDLTLHGVTKNITIDIEHIGHGKDPWGGYRRGFLGKTTFTMADFGIKANLGPASKEVEMTLSIEGIRK